MENEGKKLSGMEIFDDTMGLLTDMTARAACAALGFSVGGPTGAVIGSASVPVILRVFKELGEDVRNRMLAPREKIKVGAAISFCIEKIKSNIVSGYEIREDDFFESLEFDRSAAEEIAEGVLFAAQREHEEKKIRYYSNLLANLSLKEYSAFGRNEANLFLKIAGNLSYHDLCIISMIGSIMDGRIQKEDLQQESYRGSGNLTKEKIILLTEMLSLYNQGIISSGERAVIWLGDFNPSQLTLIGVGTHLYNLMELRDIPTEDYARDVNLLKEDNTILEIPEEDHYPNVGPEWEEIK